MKMYTSSEQTAKLIELGFERPKTKLPFEVANDELGYAYSIGELIEMLPTSIKTDCNENAYLVIEYFANGWEVYYSYILNAIKQSRRSEFIDALYDMILKLKEEGVI